MSPLHTLIVVVLPPRSDRAAPRRHLREPVSRPRVALRCGRTRPVPQSARAAAVVSIAVRVIRRSRRDSYRIGRDHGLVDTHLIGRSFRDHPAEIEHEQARTRITKCMSCSTNSRAVPPAKPRSTPRTSRSRRRRVRSRLIEQQQLGPGHQRSPQLGQTAWPVVSWSAPMGELVHA